MDRGEFERIRNLHRKKIEVDIRFEKDAAIAAVLTFKNIRITNELGYILLLNGTYKPRLKCIIYNVRIENLGPICRICVNGVEHGNAGRTHKHSLATEECSKSGNLGKDVVPRPDLEGKTAHEVFKDFCARARILHTGKFYNSEDT